MSTEGWLARFTGRLWQRRCCRLCGAVVCAPVAACPACRRDLSPAPPTVCAICGGPRSGGPCAHCGDRCWPPVRAAFRYGFPLDRLLLGLKYGQDTALADLLGALLWDRLRHAAPPSPVTLVPVPLHGARLRARGFNQSALIARRVGAAARWPLFYRVRRVRDTGAQTGRGRRERQRSLDGAFQVTAPPPPRVLVVDDVFTTGATSRALAAALARAGARVVGIWCVAWTPPGARRMATAQTSTFTAASALRSMNSRRGST